MEFAYHWTGWLPQCVTMGMKDEIQSHLYGNRLERAAFLCGVWNAFVTKFIISFP